MWMYWIMHRFLILFTHLVASLSIFLWHLWGSSMFSWVEPQKTFFPSHDQCLGGAARSLLVLGTQGTPVINQVLLLSHLALLLPKANFVLGTGLGLAQGESGSWDILSSGYNTRCTSSEQAGQCGTAGGGGTEQGTDIFPVFQMMQHCFDPMLYYRIHKIPSPSILWIICMHLV